MTGAPTDACSGHGGVAAEVRALALAALDRVGPALDRLAAEPADPGRAEVPCEICPVCAVILLLRGERPELAVRLAEHAAGLVSVLRAALDEGAGGPGAAGEGPGAAPPTPGRTVQRIPVTRPC